MFSESRSEETELKTKIKKKTLREREILDDDVKRGQRWKAVKKSYKLLSKRRRHLGLLRNM